MFKASILGARGTGSNVMAGVCHASNCMVLSKDWRNGNYVSRLRILYRELNPEP